MDVNTILCVGRTGRLTPEPDVASPRKRLFASPNRSYSAAASRAEFSNIVDHANSHLDYASSTRKSRASLSPRTKSILRGSLSPKQGSPSSVRSVRFSDDETSDGNASEFSKIHVNECTQTEHAKRVDKNTHGNLREMEDHKHVSAIGTPRQDKTGGKENGRNHKPPLIAYTPKINSGIPRTQEDSGNRSPVTKPKASKIPRLDKCWASSDKRQTDGSQIIKNLPLKASPVTNKTQMKLSMNDGRKIIQNMQFEPRRNSTGSQTASIPDGHKIVQNMEFSTPVTVDLMPDSETESKVTNIGVQTEDLKVVQKPQIALTVKENKPNESGHCLKSISVQTTDARDQLDLSLEKSKEDGSKIIQNMTLTRFKSIGIQTVKIPDGSRIIQNMDLGDKRDEDPPVITVSEDTLMSDKQPRGLSKKDVTTQYEEKTIESKSKNESARKSHEPRATSPQPTPDGNAIIKNMSKTAELLDLMSLDSDSSDSFDISISSLESPRKDPIIVYNSSAHSESNTQNNSKHSWESDVSEEVIDHCAMSLLQRDMSLNKGEPSVPVKKSFTSEKRQTTESLKQKVKDTSYEKQCKQREIPKTEHNKVNLPHWDDFLQTRTYQGFDRTTGKIVPMFYKHVTDHDAKQNHEKHKESATEMLEKRQNFVKTPIETFSFKPGSLSNLGKTEHPTHSTPRDMSPRNAFIKELDLGPIPRVDEEKIPLTPKQQSTVDMSRDRFVQPVSLHTPPKPQLPRQQVQYNRRREHFPIYSARNAVSTSSGRSSVSQGFQRPSSAPVSQRWYSDIKQKSRSPIHKSRNWLTTNLNQIRNTAIRKSSMHTSHDFQNSGPSLSKGDARSSSYDTYRDTGTVRNTAAGYRYGYGSEKVLERQSRSRDRTSRSIPPASSAGRYDLNSATMRDVSADREGAPRLYLDSLTADSNKRPDPKERLSRSRSRSPIVITEKRFDGKDSTFLATSYGAVNKSGGQTQTNSARRQSPSPHRPVEGRKPPLPVNTRQKSKSPSPCRSNHPSSAKESAKNDQSGYDTTKMLSPQNIDSKITSDASSKLSIGKAPDRVQNKSCVFLDEKTMLKIIEEANL